MAEYIYLYNILEKMLEIVMQKIPLDDSSPFFVYRRILGLELKRRVRTTVYIEEEFLEMYAPGSMSDVVNQGLNLLAVHQGRIE